MQNTIIVYRFICPLGDCIADKKSKDICWFHYNNIIKEAYIKYVWFKFDCTTFKGAVFLFRKWDMWYEREHHCTVDNSVIISFSKHLLSINYHIILSTTLMSTNIANNFQLDIQFDTTAWRNNRHVNKRKKNNQIWKNGVQKMS